MRLGERLQHPSAPYFVPGLWIDGHTTPAQAVHPYQFFKTQIERILATPAQPLINGEIGGEWSKKAIIYNLFPRVTTAFDHDQDGALTIGVNKAGWRETGSLLKCIALLPYLKTLGFNTIHFLPITSVGQDGKKGTLGSPYGIRNPYRLDETLDEPILGLGVELLFGAFMEAAHHLGFRVVMEFVLRTSSKDGDMIKEHPEWYYWVWDALPDREPGSRDPAAYGNPIFPEDRLWLVHAKVNEGNFHDLPPPPLEYQAMFAPPPARHTVYLENGRWIGTLPDGSRVRIPGAFADWPPEDNQPPWSDVTYLRMYDHPDFNYIAYNTIRMYDERLADSDYQNEPLWEYLVGVIPYWQRTYGIDGVMIDMGHALPPALKARIVGAARAYNSDFAFWDENFSLSAQSRAEGYNAVMGYLMFDMHQPHKVREFVHRLGGSPSPVGFFAAPENHNTQRAGARPGGIDYVRHAITLCMTLPGMPFVLSGLELGETQPINTGLGFTNEQLQHYPTEKLPLFSAYAFDWTRPDHLNLVHSMRQAISLRHRYEALFMDSRGETFQFGFSDHPAIFVFSRVNEHKRIGIVVNMDVHHASNGRAVFQSNARHAVGVFGVQGNVPLHDELCIHVALSPGQLLVMEY
jgi:glycosidase